MPLTDQHSTDKRQTNRRAPCEPKSAVAEATTLHDNMSMSMEQATGDAAAAGALTKTERGRLKKLRRRAALGDDSITSSSSGGSHRTGIVTHADYIELSDLLNRSSSAGGNLGPSVLVSNRPVYSEEDYTNVDRWQQSSGADHRDIIRSLLFHDGASSGSSDPNSARGGKKKGKRKRDSSAAKQALPSLPSWARIHNPAACTGLVVVEFYISDSSSQEALMPSKRMERTENNTIHKLLSKDGCHGRRAVPFATRLFQGDKPRHMTDVLLYTDISSSQEQQRSVSKTAADSKDENVTGHGTPSSIVSILESFVLKRKDRRKERYPCQVLEKKRPPKKKRHKMTEAELAEEQREVDRKTAQQTVKEKIAEKLPPFLTNIATDEHSKKCSQLFEGAFSREEAIDLVQKLEVKVLGQDEYTTGEVFIPTIISSRSQDPSPSASIFAIDCEMVETSAGRELARITLIRFEPTEQDANGYKVVLDLLVKPVRAVLDYKTQYSGITAAMLEPVTTRIEQVQIALASIVGANDIMIGHSLENDLRALCLVHEKVVDTAMLFRTESGARKHCELCLFSCHTVVLDQCYSCDLPRFSYKIYFVSTISRVGTCSSKAPVLGSTKTKDTSGMRVIGALFRGGRSGGSFACPQPSKDWRFVSALRSTSP